MRPEFDDRDAELRARYLAAWDRIEGPRVGDYVDLPDGSRRKFTHDWGDGLQTTCGPRHPCHGDTSFYLGDGYTSFSGSLDPAIPRDKIQATDEVADGRFWFFHHGHTQAHNGVYFSVPCRVFKVAP